MGAEDLPLLNRLRAGDATARRELFARCQTKLRPFFRTRVRHADEVDDLVSEVVVRALEGLRNGQEPRELDAWLTGIAHNLLKAHYTDSSRRDDRDVPDQAVDPDTDVEDLMTRARVLDVLRGALSGVPAGLRPVMAAHIRLTAQRGRLVVGAELAEELGVPRGQADRQLQRARKATENAVTSYVIGHVGASRCARLAALVTTPFDPKQSTLVLDHAAECSVCGARRVEARDCARWALGPGLIGVAHDDEHRRTALAFFGRGTEFATAPRFLGSLGSRVMSLPGVDAAVRAAQENPALVRVAAGGIGLVAAAVIAVLATQPEVGVSVSLPTTQVTAPPYVPTLSTETPPQGAQPVIALSPTPTATSARTSAARPAPTSTSAPDDPPPATSPTPTSTSATPPTSTTSIAPPPPPPPAPKWAYARVEPWRSPIGEETELSATWQWGTPQPATVTREDTGVYRLRFPGQASDTSVAHATVTFYAVARPVGCVVRDNRRSGADQVVVVACAEGGTPADTRFNVLVAEPAPGTTVIGPDAPVRRTGVGTYEVDLPSEVSGYTQVTPYGPEFARCQSSGVRGRTLRVHCDRDTRWAATHVQRVAPAGQVGAYAQTTGVAPDLRIDPTRSYNSTGGAFTLHRLGVGQYRVLVKGVGTWGGTAFSGATESGYCHTQWWHTFTYPLGEVWVDVQCVDETGALADRNFGIATIRPPFAEDEPVGPLQPADPGPSRPGWGYTQVHQYTTPLGVPAQLNPNHQWSTWGGYLPGNDHWWARKASIVRTGVGEYTVRMPGLAKSPVAHVTAHSQSGDVCVVRDQRVDGEDALVGVNCHTAVGTPKNTAFHVYVGTGRLVTSADATRLGVGEYEVAATAGHAQLTPTGTFARCRHTVGTTIRVSCDRDTTWQLSYVTDTGLHGDPVPSGYLAVGPAGTVGNSFSTTGEVPSVVRTAPGRYTVKYTTLGFQTRVWPTDTVQVSVLGDEVRTCSVAALNGYMARGAVELGVWCFDAAGRPADSAFALSYLRPPDR
ncbi:RNA polymerase sigma factor [Saccharothrix variisporea]|nr:RNA polymerase sigma factor [Saccharothrix variisporea]